MSTIGNWRGPNIVKDGLVLYLDPGSPNSYLDKTSTTWKDISGNGKNATLTNGVAFYSTNGGIFSFDGVDDYVISTLTNSTGIANPTLYSSNISVSCWFKTDSNRLNQYVLSSGAQTSSTGIALLINDGDSNDYFAIKTETKNWVLRSDIIPLGQWCNICFLTDDSSFLVYKNGVIVASTYVSTTVNNPTNNLGMTLGVPNNFSINPIQLIQGSIANVQIYSRALTAVEVLQNYNVTKSRFGL